MAGAPYRIGVISDTHGLLHPRVFRIFEGVDEILHAGDVEGDHILTELAAIAPVRAVSGNVDPPPNGNRPLTQTLETPCGRIALTHGHLPHAPSTDLYLMKSFFEDFAPQIMIYGHSHIPKLERVDGALAFNPGSAGYPRFGRRPSVGLIEKDENGDIVLRHVELPWPIR